MVLKHAAQCGSWPSPMDAESVAAAAHDLSQLRVVGDQLYWVEQFPEQKGRRSVVCLDGYGDLHELTDRNFNVRNRVHEYGGGDYCLHQQTLFFSNDRDQRWYRKDPQREAIPLTPAPEQPMAWRYADPVVTPHGDYLICVRETHGAPNDVRNEIVAIPTDGSARVTVLVSGADFYAAPRLNAHGDELVYLCWQHPNMPWDGTALYWQKLAGVTPVGEAKRLAGGAQEAICQPQFHPNGDVYFVSDRDNWWNLYRYHAGEVLPVVRLDAEFAYPQWIFGTCTYAFVDDETLVCLVNEKGRMWLALIHDDKLHELQMDYDYFAPTLAVQEGQVYVIAANAACAMAIVQVDLLTHEVRVLHSSTHLLIDAAYFSLPQSMTFPTEDGAVAHAYYYPPQHPYYQPLPQEKPPLIVLSHGGPTACASTALNLKIQYWTTRGFAVVDVNYRGSVGFGRAYREALYGQWGLVDVSDCVQAAQYLVKAGWVDPQRLIIKGSSAGGFTTLCALTFHDVFAAGASYYGVADLAGLVQDTHKFESHYLDRLIGPYPQEQARYRARSPLYHADQLHCPVIFLQGLEDKVVPPAQAEAMMAALEAKQVPYAYVVFPHEQHGFRDARSIERALESELSFYAQIFAFSLPEEVEPLVIKHFEASKDPSQPRPEGH